jgi:ABC-type branched-subunit amino acid transport system permease subunit
MKTSIMNIPGAFLVRNALIAAAIAAVFLLINTQLEPTFSFYLAQAAMYATAMFGMVILVGLSGQVSLGNGALMAVGAYTFALTSLNWETVPILGLPWNAVWSVVAAGLVGVIAGVIIGGLGARLSGPYLAGLTLGIAVGLPAIIYRFPSLLGGEDGFALRVPYPAGGYATLANGEEAAAEGELVDDGFEEFLAEAGSDSSETLEFDQEQLADDQVLEFDQEELAQDQETAVTESPADEEILEFDQEELILDQEATVDEVPTAEPDVAAEPTVPESAGDLSDAGALDAAGVVDASGFILEQWQASLAITMAAIVGFVALNLIRGHQGRTWKAVRDDSVAASLVGISTKSNKVSAFVVSGFFAALAGAVMAQIFAYVGPALFGLGLSLSLLVGVILGGRASLLGAILGAAFIVMLPEVVQSIAQQLGWSDRVAGNLPDLIYGLLVVIVVLVLPGGLVGSLLAARRRRA